MANSAQLHVGVAFVCALAAAVSIGLPAWFILRLTGWRPGPRLVRVANVTFVVAVTTVFVGCGVSFAVLAVQNLVALL